MSIHDDIHDQIKKPHVPMRMLKHEISEQDSNGIAVIRTKLWSCFYDQLDQRLKVWFAGFRYRIGHEDLMFQRLGTVSKVVTNSHEPIHAQIRKRYRGKERDGMMIVPGSWYIQPETPRLVDINDLAPEFRREINLTDSLSPESLFGDEENEPSDHPGRSSPSDFRQDITNRLAQANPIAHDWFFSTCGA